MANRTRIIDRGYQKIIRQTLELDRQDIFVGIPASKDEPRDGSSMVMIAAVNEFGSMDGRIPQRSYLRSTLEEKKDEIIRTLESAYKGVADLRLKASDARSLVGLKVSSLVRQKIVAIRTPPNAPATIRKKGSSNPLIDTGRLRQSIAFVVRRRTGR